VIWYFYLSNTVETGMVVASHAVGLTVIMSATVTLADSLLIERSLLILFASYLSI